MGKAGEVRNAFAKKKTPACFLTSSTYQGREKQRERTGDRNCNGLVRRIGSESFESRYKVRTGARVRADVELCCIFRAEFKPLPHREISQIKVESAASYLEVFPVKTITLSQEQRQDELSQGKKVLAVVSFLTCEAPSSNASCQLDKD